MLPERFLERMRELLGEEYEDFLRTFEEERYQALRMNPLKQKSGAEGEMEVKSRGAESRTAGNRESESRESGGKEELLPFDMTRVSWEGNGFYYSAEDQPGRHPFHEAGLYYIQEPSAMAVAPLLEVQPGERVLDLCAAPGGKSTQIAGYLQGKGLLVSNEIHPARAKILSENIERLGVINACVTNESPTSLSERFPMFFDKILVDAPCSGEGMFRKNEMACEEWSPENVERCAVRQDEILDCAAGMLRPGGRLVYSTCTFAPQEDEGSVRRFLQRHPDFSLLPIDKEKLGLPEGVCDGRPEWAQTEDRLERKREEELDWVCKGEESELCETQWAEVSNPVEIQGDDGIDMRGTLRLWPHRIKGEGHFAAVLQKSGAVSAGQETMAAGGVEKGISGKDKELAAWWEFWHETAETDKVYLGGAEIDLREGKYLYFGENLYLIPEALPSLKGLKVLRPGLHLGTQKKQRFEPAHALALALQPDKMRHICHLSAKEELITAYLGGQTFPYDGEKGWYLITVDGYSIGWGKLAGGIMKNHYPKGLRRTR